MLILLPLAITRIESDDDRAFVEGLYVAYRVLMYRQAYSILYHKEGAEDALTDCWIALCDHIPRLRELAGRDGELRRYVVRCARNQAIHAKRANAREAPVGSYEDILSAAKGVLLASARAEAWDMQEGLRAALRALPPTYYDVLQMAYTDGMKAREIGRTMRLKESSVWVYLSRARKLALSLWAKERARYA